MNPIKGRLRWIAALLAIAYWIIESALHRWVHGDSTFELLPADGNELLMRATVCGLIMAFGIYAHRELERRARLDAECAALQEQLATALTHVLSGFLSICSNCKRIRDDHNRWQHVERYVSERTDTEFSHGICPECSEELYPGLGPTG